jgi:carbon starvation protein CstA
VAGRPFARRQRSNTPPPGPARSSLCAARCTESAFSNVVAPLLCVSAWGWFVYQGTIDPLGGVNTIWPLFGISNQMLAGIVLLLATLILIKLKRDRYAWVTLMPTGAVADRGPDANPGATPG